MRANLVVEVEEARAFAKSNNARFVLFPHTREAFEALALARVNPLVVRLVRATGSCTLRAALVRLGAHYALKEIKKNKMTKQS